MADGLNPGMVNRVNRLWKGDAALPDLVDVAEAVERTLGTPGWAVIQRLIGEEIAEIDSSLDSGSAKVAEEYAKQHGRRGALRMAEEAARAVISQAAVRKHRAQESADRESEGAGESVPERTF